MCVRVCTCAHVCVRVCVCRFSGVSAQLHTSNEASGQVPLQVCGSESSSPERPSPSPSLRRLPGKEGYSHSLFQERPFEEVPAEQTPA